MTTSKRYALISVTDKTGVLEFARGLKECGFDILSTGGTAVLLRDNDVPVTDVATYTGHPECLDGRVKTLHPKVHGGILAKRSSTSHLADMERLGFSNIDVVAVNLYDFAGKAKGQDLSLSQVIEHIDVGGPTMLRAAAKNHESVYAVVDPGDYAPVIESLRSKKDDPALRASLALKVFTTTAAYDQMIASDLASRLSPKESAEQTTATATTAAVLPEQIHLELTRVQSLRYGENSHQNAALYAKGNYGLKNRAGLTHARILQGKELSYNNFVDLDAAAAIVADLDPIPSVTIIKHTNPCGTASGKHATSADLFAKAFAADPKCAFGGIVASNVAIDLIAAKAMAEIFLECIIAPKFTSEALAHFATKKNLRIVESNVTTKAGRQDSWLMRSVEGGLLVQTPDDFAQNTALWTCVSQAKPTPEVLAELKFAMTLCRHVKSNAIVITKDLRSIGIGAGQMSRVDSAGIAVAKAKELGHSPCDGVAASDAFFPFRDSVDILAKAGITAIVQPGGSVRDQESIDAANEHGMVMMMTGNRHFKH